MKGWAEYTKKQKYIIGGIVISGFVLGAMLWAMPVSASPVKKPSGDGKDKTPPVTGGGGNTPPLPADQKIQKDVQDAGITFNDGKTDFTKYDKAPYAAWIAPTQGVNIGDKLSVKNGANVMLFDTNMKSVGNGTAAMDGAFPAVVWGLNPAYALVEINPNAPDDILSGGFNNAAFAGIQYKDVLKPTA